MKNVKLTHGTKHRAVLLLVSLTLLASCASTAQKDDGTGEQYNNDVFQLSALAERAYRESRWVEAERHYQQLTQQVPTDAYMWFRLANTYVQKGDFDQAINAYEESIARDAMQPKPWFNLSTTYLLNAKAALLESWQKLRGNDPARLIIQARIDAIDALLNDNLNEVRVRR